MAALAAFSLRISATGHLERLAALIDSDGARAIGRRYMAAHVEEASRRVLAGLITDADPSRWVGAPSDRTLRARWQTTIARDFAQGATVEIDGWILSRTEARLCALTALA